MADDSQSESDEAADDAAPVPAGPRFRAVAMVAENRVVIAAILCSIVLAVGAIIYLRSQVTIVTEEEKLQIALRLVDRIEDFDARHRASRIAAGVIESGYRSPEFEGGPEFVLGVAAFRDAEQLMSAEKDDHYMVAIQYLQEADRLGIVMERRPEWDYALGLSLYRIGAEDKALPHLEAAIHNFPHGRHHAVIATCEVYLDSQTPAAIEKAHELNALVVEAEHLDPDLRDRAWLQRAQICLQLNRNDEAEAALAQVSELRSENHGTLVFRGQTLMAEGKYQEAMDILAPVARGVGLIEVYSRQALYLHGVCAHELGQTEVAINMFKRCAQKYPQTHEGLAAGVQSADLLRESARNEEALEAYRNTLAHVDDPNNYRNRWISLDNLRARILDAWDAWTRNGHFDEAIKLAKVMPPTFEPSQAQRLEALASQRWAEYTHDQLQNTPHDEREPVRGELIRRWKASGDAFRRLAATLGPDAEASPAIWTSAEHYQRGHEFERSLEQLTLYIQRESGRRIPLALVRRGDVLMDLGRIEEALEHYERVIEHHATDPAFFESQYKIGRCYLELDQPELAEQAWRTVLDSESLTPDAQEWRGSLLALGMSLFHRGSAEFVLADGARGEDDRARALEHWETAIDLLNEFVVRYPRVEEATEARYFLALALHRSTDRMRQLLRAAETDNAREEIRDRMDITLKKSIREYRALQTQLLIEDDEQGLDDLRKRLLRDCFFEIAHASFDLQDYEAAIIAYHGAANRYPEDPHVLLAYLQMTDCHRRLKNFPQARSMLEQAKVILRQMDDSSFDPRKTNLTRDEWEQWRARSGRLHDSETNQQAPGS